MSLLMITLNLSLVLFWLTSLLFFIEEVHFLKYIFESRASLRVIRFLHVLALALWGVGLFSSRPLLCLFGISLLLAQRYLIFRKAGAPLCGGSDFLFNLGLLCLGLSTLAVEVQAPEIWIQIPLLYLGSQTLLSYLLAGLAKLRSRDWKEGHVLTDLFQAEHYPVPRVVRTWAQNETIVKVGAWVILAFEVLVPIILFVPSSLATVLIVGFAFHLINSVVLGLHRFFWIWVSSYPSLIFLALLVQSHLNLGQ